ncbi:hypothetical protein HPB48_006135 [Haemaphysalis longicornis]|uniref:Uncharacterized protein n=1 Tax=Haemaphysalis longicornis TaxID=44386 RepID=A0A9J6GZ07_HAELO|nr:hypothetical protein HPB48_006135 [Haemaphysalis longicornis]
MLAYVRNLNPFKETMEWTEIASNMQELLQQPFTARAVRDRTELLLGQYASADRTNLRRSGTEENYEKRESLLQELLDMAREHGVRIRAPRRTSTAPAVRAVRTREQQTASTTASVRISAAQSTDIFAAQHSARNADTRRVGRRRNDQEARYEFFEKRMHHEIIMKEKEAATESKRIALEEKRLELEKGAAERELRVAQEMRKQMEEMRQHMAE